MATPRAIVVSLVCIWVGLLGRPVAQEPVERRRVEMRDHYAQLIAIHDGVARGDLDAIREPAAELAILWVPAGSPASTAAFGSAIREGARRLSRETAIAGAVRATTDIIRACAGCHRGSGEKISAGAILQRRSEGSETRPGHAAAADELLLGLLLPSDERWASGADRLQTTGLPADPISSANADEILRYLGRRASQSTTVTARSSTYGLMLTTCADCHRKIHR